MLKKFADKQTGVLSSSDLRTFKGQLLYWIFIAFLVLMVFISIVPSIWTFFSAFKDSQEIITSTKFFPNDMSWNRIVTRISESWESLQLMDSILNTLWRSIGELVFKIVICGFGGYAISKLKPTGSKLVFTLIVWTLMMPGQIRMVTNYIGYLHFPFAFDMGIGVNLLDTFWPFWLGSAADCFSVLLFKNSFDALSNSYVEAAKLDGCSNFGVFFKIMFPLSMPIIIYLSIGALTAAWSDYMGPLIILNENLTLPLKLYKMKSANIKMNTELMGYTFSCIPPFLIFVCFQRYILGGINIGGVKG